MNEKIDLGLVPIVEFSQKQPRGAFLYVVADNTSVGNISNENLGHLSANIILGNLRQ